MERVREDEAMTDFRNLRTVRQIAQECPAITVGQLRWWIFNAHTNGIDMALVRVGARVYVDIEAFNRWLDALRGEL
jgi:hypothetical protein